MSKSIGCLLVLGALFAVGCGDKAAGGSDSSKPAASGDSKAGMSGDSVGVAECDEYIKTWRDCYKDPTMKAAAEPGFKQTVDAWKKTAAEGGAAKDGLKTACKAMNDAFPKDACK